MNSFKKTFFYALAYCKGVKPLTLQAWLQMENGQMAQAIDL